MSVCSSVLCPGKENSSADSPPYNRSKRYFKPNEPSQIHPPCNYTVLQYLTKVPVNPHSFLHSFFTVVETRHGFFVADIGYAAVVVIFVGLDAANVELTSGSIESVLEN